MKLYQLTRLAVISAALVGCAGFAASNDALLALLVKKGVLTESEATEVSRELEAERPVLVTAKSKAVESIKLTGRIHGQYDTEFEFGYTKVPFGLYETTSSSKIKTVERPIANRLFAESDGLQLAARNAGIFVEGDLGGGFTYASALVSNDPSNTFSDNQDDDGSDTNGIGAFGRLEWANDNFRVGVDLAHKMDGAKNLDAGAGWMPNNGDITAYGVHGVYTNGGFRLSAEFLGGTIEDANASGGDVDVYGFTVMPSYQLNEKFELVASYSAVDSDGANIIDATDLVRRSNSGDEYDEGESIYLGFNYYIIGNDLKLSGGYEFATFEDTTGSEIDIDALRLRLQLLF